MIFFLDAHGTKCASYLAVEHVRPALVETIQVLCDTTRLIIDECRITSMERKMRDAKIEVKDEKHWMELEALIPRPQKNVDDPLVSWALIDQDAWDWLLGFSTDLVDEIRNCFSRSIEDESRAVSWLRLFAPRPVHTGRVLRRSTVFPLPERYPKEFVTPDLFLNDVPDSVKNDLTVRAYRLMYWTKYRNTVRFTKTRRPWWWDSLENTKGSILASDSLDK